MLVTGFCLLPGLLPTLVSSLEPSRRHRVNVAEIQPRGHNQIRADPAHFRQRTSELSASTVRCRAGGKEQGKDGGGGMSPCPPCCDTPGVALRAHSWWQSPAGAFGRWDAPAPARLQRFHRNHILRAASPPAGRSPAVAAVQERQSGAESAQEQRNRLGAKEGRLQFGRIPW